MTRVPGNRRRGKHGKRTRAVTHVAVRCDARDPKSDGGAAWPAGWGRSDPRPHVQSERDRVRTCRSPGRGAHEVPAGSVGYRPVRGLLARFFPVPTKAFVRRPGSSPRITLCSWIRKEHVETEVLMENLACEQIRWSVMATPPSL